jgi:dTDP-4-amino-4,6-dideoxygalactose transaminase
MQTSVPFLDLKSQNARLRGEINSAIQEVIDAAAFAGGPYVVAFEADFAA